MAMSGDFHFQHTDSYTEYSSPNKTGVKFRLRYKEIYRRSRALDLVWQAINRSDPRTDQSGFNIGPAHWFRNSAEPHFRL